MTSQEIIASIGDSLSDVASSDNGEDGEDEYDGEAEQGKPSEDDEPCWVKVTICKTVPQRMKMFQQNQMNIDNLSQLGWGDAADYFRARDTMNCTSEMRVRAVVKSQTNNDAAAPGPKTFRQHMEYVDIVPGISKIPQRTSPPGNCHFRLGSEEAQSNNGIAGLVPTA